MFSKWLKRLLGKKARSQLGVDISGNCVKLLALEASDRRFSQQDRCRHQYCIAGYAIVALPEHSAVANRRDKLAWKNKGFAEEVGVAIAKAVDIVHTRENKAVVAVEGSAVITRTIEMGAELSDDDMEQQIIVEADQYIPYPLEEMVIDFERIDRGKESSAMVNVLLAACKRQSVDQRVAALERGGLLARAVEVEAYAMERAYCLLCDSMRLKKHGVAAIFNIGFSMLSMFVMLNGAAIYTRENLLDDIRNPIDIKGQISECLQLFFASSEHKAVDLIVLAGDMAASNGLADVVEKTLSTRTIVANPFLGVQLGASVSKMGLLQDAPGLMLACGLAMRGMMLTNKPAGRMNESRQEAECDRCDKALTDE